MTSRSLQYWDSCLFIAFLQNKPDEKSLVDTVETLLRDAEADKIQIVISSLVVAEVRPYVERYDEARVQYVDDLLLTDRAYIRTVAATRAIAASARNIGGQHRSLKVPDTIHLATALQERVDVFHTVDGDRDKGRRRAKDLLEYDGKVGNPPLVIKPPSASPGPLFDQAE